MGSLDGRFALVTGAGSGIGRQMSLRCAAEGARVMCADIRLDTAQESASMVESNGGTASALELDVTDEDAVREAIEQTSERLGGLDVIMNNAGVSRSSWDVVTGVNLSGVYYVLMHGAKAIQDGGGGAIVNTASIAGLVAMSGQDENADVPMHSGRAAYTAAKHGVVGLTKQFAVAYGQFGVRINAVAPGYIETPMTAPLLSDEASRELSVSLHPIGRLGKPEEVAAAAVFLASDDASFITGVVLPVDGGYTAR